MPLRRKIATTINVDQSPCPLCDTMMDSPSLCATTGKPKRVTCPKCGTQRVLMPMEDPKSWN